MIQSDEKTHATEIIRCRRRCRKDDVHEEQGLGHFPDTRHHAVRRRTCTFGIDHVPHAPAELGKDGDEDNDDTEAAKPMGQAAPNKNAARQGFDIRKHRSACAGKAGNTFQRTIENIQIAAKYIGQHAQEGNENPRQSCNGHAFTARQGFTGKVSLLFEDPAQAKIDDRRHKERYKATVLLNQSNNRRNEENQAQRLGNAAQKIQYYTYIHE